MTHYTVCINVLLCPLNVYGYRWTGSIIGTLWKTDGLEIFHDVNVTPSNSNSCRIFYKRACLLLVIHSDSLWKMCLIKTKWMNKWMNKWNTISLTQRRQRQTQGFLKKACFWPCYVHRWSYRFLSISYPA